MTLIRELCTVVNVHDHVKPTIRTFKVWLDGADSAHQQQFLQTVQIGLNLPLMPSLTQTSALTSTTTLFSTTLTGVWIVKPHKETPYPSPIRSRV